MAQRALTQVQERTGYFVEHGLGADWSNFLDRPGAPVTALRY